MFQGPAVSQAESAQRKNQEEKTAVQEPSEEAASVEDGGADPALALCLSLPQRTCPAERQGPEGSQEVWLAKPSPGKI